MNRNYIMGGLSVLICIAIVVFVWMSHNRDDSSVINLAINNEIKNLDPAIVFEDDSLTVLGEGYETLYQYHYLKRPYEIIPSLADGMPKVINDGKTYLIKIKPDVKYHPNKFLQTNRTVIAKDFINQFKRLLFTPLKSPGEWILKGRIIGAETFQEKVGSSLEKFYQEDISGIQALDELTLQINLKRPDPNFLYYLAMYFTVPVPLEVIKQTENNLSNIYVGTGPYKLIFHDDKMIKFDRFNLYHKEHYPSSGDRYANVENLLDSSKELLPLIDHVNLFIIKEEQTQWELFFDGVLDVIPVTQSYLSRIVYMGNDMKKTLDDVQGEVKYFPKITSRWIGFNMLDPVVGGSKGRVIRQAVAYGLDRNRYIETVTNNTSLKANSIYNPSIPGYNPTQELPYKYDLEKAKFLMKSAGYGENKKLKLTYSTRGDQETHIAEANYLKQQFALFYVDLHIEYQSFTSFIRRGRTGNQMQIWTDNWIYDYPDAENMLQLLITKNYPGINKSGYQNAQVDELYRKTSLSYDLNEKTKYMREVEEIVNEDLPWVMLMYETSYTLNKRRIKNYRKSSFIRNYVKYLKAVR